jgi:hypothetical protein
MRLEGAGAVEQKRHWDPRACWLLYGWSENSASDLAEIEWTSSEATEHRLPELQWNPAARGDFGL